ncbi:hypothetical protein BDR26DRAFT_871208 [Obelidium mucronatum]|nr:hypothetical protein BDR26DRAFT_871208 [Obelidium mucronatum]
MSRKPLLPTTKTILCSPAAPPSIVKAVCLMMVLAGLMSVYFLSWVRGYSSLSHDLTHMPQYQIYNSSRISGVHSKTSNSFLMANPLVKKYASNTKGSPQTLRFGMTGCPPPPKLALIGMLTVPQPMNLLRQQLLRRIYLNESAKFSRDIDFKFVYGTANDTESQEALHLQQLLYPDDTVILPCLENMNEGKSFEWWKAARNLAYMRHPTNPAALCPRYEYIGKTDDDAVIHVERLQNFLRSLEKTEDPSYIGTMQIRGGGYMSGILHFLSVSLVEYITVDDHEWSEANKVGYEDKQTGEFVDHVGVRVRRVSTRRIHDYDDTPNWTCALTTNQSIAFRVTLEKAIRNYAEKKNLKINEECLGVEQRGMIEREWLEIQELMLAEDSKNIGV